MAFYRGEDLIKSEGDDDERRVIYPVSKIMGGGGPFRESMCRAPLGQDPDPVDAATLLAPGGTCQE